MVASINEPASELLARIRAELGAARKTKPRRKASALSAPAIDRAGEEWDTPTMSSVAADQKRRVPLPGAQPGDVFDVQKSPDGKYILEKLVRQTGSRPRSAAEVLVTMETNPLDPLLRWEELRQQTREP